jgi:hypothetical protein
MSRSTPFLMATVALVAVCAGCPGSLEDPGRFMANGTAACPDVPQDIFLKICGTAGCHSTVDKMLGLDLQSPDVAARLTGVSAMGGAGLLIDPSAPAMSVIYTKLTPTPPFGVRMPFARTPLDDATIACVLQWITAATSPDASLSEAAATDASPEEASPGDEAPSGSTPDASPDEPPGD